jgi:hypothetical protein
MKPSGKTLLLCALALGLVLSAAPAPAEEPHLISRHGNWTAFNFIEDGKKVCYMASQPKKMESTPPNAKRGDVFALITNRPADGTKNVFSYITGYTYKAGENVTVTIDNKERFTLFTQGDTAWMVDGAADNKIAAAIRKGKTMTVKGVSARGVKTTDTFTLAGSGGAHDAINKDCGGK